MGRDKYFRPTIVIKMKKLTLVAPLIVKDALFMYLMLMEEYLFYPGVVESLIILLDVNECIPAKFNVEAYKVIIDALQTNFPCVLDTMFVLNTSSPVKVAWSKIESYVAPQTIPKIQFLSPNETFKLASLFEPNQLFAEFGGTKNATLSPSEDNYIEETPEQAHKRLCKNCKIDEPSYEEIDPDKAYVSKYAPEEDIQPDPDVSLHEFNLEPHHDCEDCRRRNEELAKILGKPLPVRSANRQSEAKNTPQTTSNNYGVNDYNNQNNNYQANNPTRHQPQNSQSQQQPYNNQGYNQNSNQGVNNHPSARQQTETSIYQQNQPTGLYQNPYQQQNPVAYNQMVHQPQQIQQPVFYPQQRESENRFSLDPQVLAQYNYQVPLQQTIIQPQQNYINPYAIQPPLVFQQYQQPQMYQVPQFQVPQIIPYAHQPLNYVPQSPSQVGTPSYAGSVVSQRQQQEENEIDEVINYYDWNKYGQPNVVPVPQHVQPNLGPSQQSMQPVSPPVNQQEVKISEQQQRLRSQQSQGARIEEQRDLQIVQQLSAQSPPPIQEQFDKPLSVRAQSVKAPSVTYEAKEVLYPSNSVNVRPQFETISLPYSNTRNTQNTTIKDTKVDACNIF